MNKTFRIGSLLIGLGLCIGCGAPDTSTQAEPAMEAPGYEQEMTGAAEETAEVVEEAVVETTEEAPAEAPAEAAAPEAPAEAAPAAEEAAPAATDAP
ncbi:MAG: hypothetical protein H6823_08135 [Planctomycetaceae bacterium]|nr:hypothetical protein [Planctomycetales bacterium]MCB9938195.1 hypothetical protein [Planctomycetaceae bacterium]